jgi:hypothetical protein
MIDNFIQEMQLKINSQTDIVVEWIPYDQLNDIKVKIKIDSSTVYSAIWMDGPLSYDGNKIKYTRSQQNEKVSLKCLHNSQIISNEFLNEV